MSDTYFDPADLAVLRALEYNPSATVSIEAMAAYLLWDDEVPKRGMSRDGKFKLKMLLSARCCVHRGEAPGGMGFKQFYDEEVWNKAKQEIPNWPGFQRLELSPGDREFLETYTKELLDWADGLHDKDPPE